MFRGQRLAYAQARMAAIAEHTKAWEAEWGPLETKAPAPAPPQTLATVSDAVCLDIEREDPNICPHCRKKSLAFYNDKKRPLVAFRTHVWHCQRQLSRTSRKKS